MEPNEKPESNTEQVVFYSKAIKARIANWKSEIRDGQGRITRPEASIRFFDNLYVTSNPAEIAFIRDSSALANGDVVECEGGGKETAIEQAQRLISQRAAVKYGAKREETASYFDKKLISESN